MNDKPVTAAPVFSDEEIAEASRIAEEMRAGHEIGIVLTSAEDLEALLGVKVYDEEEFAEIVETSASSHAALEAARRQPLSADELDMLMQAEIEQVAAGIETDIDGESFVQVVPEIEAFEAAVRLFGATTMKAVVVEEVYGIDTADAVDARDVFNHLDLLHEYREALAGEGPTGERTADDLDVLQRFLAETDPTAQIGVVDVAFAKKRIEILLRALENLHYAVRDGRVSESRFEAAQRETETLLAQFGHEADYVHTGADVVVVDFNYRNDEPAPEV